MTNDDLLNSIQNIAQDISNKILSDFQDISDEITDSPEKWYTLPSSVNRNLTVGAVDGGSRTMNTRGGRIVYAQASGRVMGSAEYKSTPWEERRTADYLQSGLATDIIGRIRERLEITVAADLLEKYKFDYLLLDGALDGLFRIGIPAQVRITADKNQILGENHERFRREIIAYGEVLQEFLQLAAKKNTAIICLSKDSYADSHVPVNLKSSILTDTNYFSFISKGKAGYSREIEKSAEEMLTANPAVQKLWNDAGVSIPSEYLRTTTFYATTINHGIPIRIDQFATRKKQPDLLLADLMTFSDGKDWFIPPRFAHEHAVIKGDMFDSLIRQVFVRVNAKNYVLANVLLGLSRRQRTQ